MPFTHDTGEFNIRGSLMAWLDAGLQTNKPDSIASVRLNYDHPEQPLAPPEWSVYFLGSFNDPAPFGGANVGDGKTGGRRYGLLEVDCWASRNNTAWRKQLAQMGDSVTKTYHAAASNGVRVYDFYTSETTPSALAYRIVLDGIEEREVAPDPNPDIERRRLLIHFNWIERV